MQAYLVARLLAEVNATLKAPAEKLAARIAENRVIAGVHYPTDTAGSIRSVDLIMALLPRFEDEDFQQLLAAAKDEHQYAEMIPANDLVPDGP